VHEDDVAQVDIGLPALQSQRADTGQADHRLQLGAVALLQGGETQLAGIADEDHPAGDADQVTGRGVDGQVGVLGADLRQGVGAPDGDRVGVAALGQQPSPLVAADPELFGKLGCGIRAGIRAGFTAWFMARVDTAHDVPA
jgi:hypothetical protein